MPTKTYYLDAAQTEPITLHWGLFWKNFTISQAGTELLRLPGRRALKEGATVTLPDGRVLGAQLKQQLNQEELELLLDGRPLPGSATHPHYRLQQAVYTLVAVGVLNVLLGLLAELGAVATLQQLGFGYPTVVVGLVFLGLAWWAKAKEASLPLYLGMGLLVLDVVVSLAGMGPSGTPPTAGLLLRFFLVMLLYKGATAVRQIRAEQAGDSAASVQ
jgi:hypothetical protein